MGFFDQLDQAAGEVGDAPLELVDGLVEIFAGRRHRLLDGPESAPLRHNGRMTFALATRSVDLVALSAELFLSALIFSLTRVRAWSIL